MNTKETTYKKEPVRLQLRQRAGGKQVVYLEFYKEGVRTYERIPDMMIVSETDQKAIKANQADWCSISLIETNSLRNVKKSLDIDIKTAIDFVYCRFYIIFAAKIVLQKQDGHIQEPYIAILDKEGLVLFGWPWGMAVGKGPDNPQHHELYAFKDGG